jgi:hypothetical protein
VGDGALEDGLRLGEALLADQAATGHQRRRVVAGRIESLRLIDQRKRRRAVARRRELGGPGAQDARLVGREGERRNRRERPRRTIDSAAKGGRLRGSAMVRILPTGCHGYSCRHDSLGALSLRGEERQADPRRSAVPGSGMTTLANPELELGQVVLRLDRRGGCRRAAR